MARRPPGMFRRGALFYFKFKRDSGDWAERATHKSSLDDAIAVRNDFLRELHNGQLPNDRSLWTLRRAAEDWLEDRKFRVARGTYSSDRSMVQTLMQVMGDGIRLIKLADQHVIRKYESSRLASGVSPKTVNNELLVLKSILRDANLWHRVAAHYRPLRVPKSKVGAALTKEESRRFIRAALAAAPNAAAPFGALLSFATGMRCGEILRLRLGAIHLEAANAFLEVHRSTTKTDSGARYVALDSMACWAVMKLLDRARRLGAVHPEHCLFPTLLQKHTRKTDPLHGGRGYDPCHPQTSWGDEWTTLRNSLGIRHRRFHDLRHTYVTRAAEAGVPLAVTQAQVGHMSVQMVEHYTHICHAAIHHAARQIERNSADLLPSRVFSQSDQLGRPNNDN